NVFDLAKKPGDALHASRALDTRFLVGEERARRVATELFQIVPETYGVFERLARSLRDVLKHGVRRVSQQSDAISRPVRDRKAVKHRPAPVAFDLGDGGSHARAHLAEMLFQFVHAAPIVRAFPVSVAPEYRDLVEEFSAMHTVLHEVQVGPYPQKHAIEVRFG